MPIAPRTAGASQLNNNAPLRADGAQPGRRAGPVSVRFPDEITLPDHRSHYRRGGLQRVRPVAVGCQPGQAVGSGGRWHRTWGHQGPLAAGDPPWGHSLVSFREGAATP